MEATSSYDPRRGHACAVPSVGDVAGGGTSHARPTDRTDGGLDGFLLHGVFKAFRQGRRKTWEDLGEIAYTRHVTTLLALSRRNEKAAIFRGVLGRYEAILGLLSPPRSIRMIHDANVSETYIDLVCGPDAGLKPPIPSSALTLPVGVSVSQKTAPRGPRPSSWSSPPLGDDVADTGAGARPTPHPTTRGRTTQRGGPGLGPHLAPGAAQRRPGASFSLRSPSPSPVGPRGAWSERSQKGPCRDDSADGRMKRAGPPAPSCRHPTTTRRSPPNEERRGGWGGAGKEGRKGGRGA